MATTKAHEEALARTHTPTRSKRAAVTVSRPQRLSLHPATLFLSEPW